MLSLQSPLSGSDVAIEINLTWCRGIRKSWQQMQTIEITSTFRKRTARHKRESEV